MSSLPRDQHWATIYVLFFSDYYDQHRCLVDTMLRYLPAREARIVCWCNTVGERSAAYLAQELYGYRDAVVILSDRNVVKHPAMRMLFTGDFRPDTSWVLWLDDDMRATDPGWWETARAFIEQNPGVDAFGRRCIRAFDEPTKKWVREAEWYKGKPFADVNIIPGHGPLDGTSFLLGGYTWIKKKVIHAMDWPDKRLGHCDDGDIMLGAALHQHGYTLASMDIGVDTRGAPRRSEDEEWVAKGPVT
jgi:hypothetical protein